MVQFCFFPPMWHRPDMTHKQRSTWNMMLSDQFQDSFICGNKSEKCESDMCICICYVRGYYPMQVVHQWKKNKWWIKTSTQVDTNICPGCNKSSLLFDSVNVLLTIKDGAESKSVYYHFVYTHCKLHHFYSLFSLFFSVHLLWVVSPSVLRKFRYRI